MLSAKIAGALLVKTVFCSEELGIKEKRKYGKLLIISLLSNDKI